MNPTISMIAPSPSSVGGSSTMRNTRSSAVDAISATTVSQLGLSEVVAAPLLHDPRRVIANEREQLAEIAVSARYNAGLNPEAYYRDPITIDDVQSSRMIADPLHLLEIPGAVASIGAFVFAVTLPVSDAVLI